MGEGTLRVNRRAMPIVAGPDSEFLPSQDEDAEMFHSVRAFC
jgi:hypothetical protein